MANAEHEQCRFDQTNNFFFCVFTDLMNLMQGMRYLFSPENIGPLAST